MKNKKTLTIVFAIFLLILLTPMVSANYQIHPTRARAKASFTTFANGVRSMEAPGDVMGLSEQHSPSTLAATTPTNNIDVHLTKNTEFGAALILSASPKYGKQGTGSLSYIDKNTTTGIATTTGNQYGVYEMGSSGIYEWISGGGTSALGTSAYLDRYYNRYSSETSKAGDATTETLKWKASNFNTFATGGYVVIRGIQGAFSYNKTAANSTGYCGRASVVCGIGF